MRHTVHEYGGLAHALVCRATDCVSLLMTPAGHSLNMPDLDITEPSSRPCSQFHAGNADFDYHPDIAYATEDSAWVLAIDENHAHPKPSM